MDGREINRPGRGEAGGCSSKRGAQRRGIHDWPSVLLTSTASLVLLASLAAISPARAECPDGGDGQLYYPGAGCGTGESGGTGGSFYDDPLGGAGAGDGGVGYNPGGGGGGEGSGGGGGMGGFNAGDGGVDGGYGGYSNSSQYYIWGQGGGGGGGGGAGLIVNTEGTITGTYRGGNGGAGGNGADSIDSTPKQTLGGGGGGGGGGGIGVVIQAPGSYTFYGSAQGGNGGKGGNGGGDGGFDLVFGGGGGGAGASGIAVTGAQLTIAAGATVQGGNGGAGGLGSDSSGDGGAGQGGAGISAQNATLVIGGSVSGGLSGDGVQGAAIRVLGGTNSLTFLNAASGLTGGIALENAATLAFEQPTDVALASAITGSGSITKAGAGTLTLSGVNTYTGTTTLAEGTLSVSNNNQLGRTTSTPSGLSFDGGTLEVTGTAFTSTNRAIAFGAHGGTIKVADAANSLSLSGTMTGSGRLTKSGAGTLVLTVSNTSFTGDTYLVGGTLSVSNNNQLGQTSGNPPDLYFDGGTLRVTGSSMTNLGNRVVNWLDGGGGFNIAASGNSFTVGSALSGTGGLVKSGTGTLVLSGSNSYSGDTTVSAGTLKAGAAGGLSAASAHSIGANGRIDLAGFNATIGSLAGSAGAIVTNSATSGTARLTAGGNNSSTTYAGVLGNGSRAATALTKAGSGTLTLTGANTYTGGTTVAAGTLRIGAGGTSGSIAGNVGIDAGGTLAFDRSDNISFTGLSGQGDLRQQGSGRLTLTGDNSTFTGGTTVAAGRLSIGAGSVLGGAVAVRAGGVLEGTGSVLGAVTVDDDGVLAPGNSPGTLTVGALVLNNASRLQFELDQPNTVADGINDRVDVTGSLALDGILDIDAQLNFGAGSYRLFNYGELAVDNELIVASGPAGYNFVLDTTQAGQVNLVVNYDGLQFWNGGTTAADGSVHGGSGTWNAAATNWTDVDGNISNPWASGLTAVFAGTSGGTVTIAGDVAVAGLQFGTDGYRLEGPGDILIAATDTEFRVDAGLRAEIAAGITGAGGLLKTSGGTLVLSGANSYAGGTRILAGIVEVSADNNLGEAASAIALSGGTLATTASFDTGRSVSLSNQGTVAVAEGTTLGLTGIIDGTGQFRKDGLGTLVLIGANSYGGGTVIVAGTLQIGDGGSHGWIVGDVANDGLLRFSRSDATTFDGAIRGTGALELSLGTLTLTAENSYEGGTSIDAGATLRLGSGGAAGSITGDVLNDGTLAFNRSDSIGFAGAFSGTGDIRQTGPGFVNLTGDSSGFAGATTVEAGTLAVNGKLGGTLEILAGARLQGMGTVGTTTVSGTIAPGNSIGTLHVAGDIQFDPDSIYEVEANEDGETDSIVATGEATLLGGTVRVLAGTGTYAPATTYTILTANGGILGDGFETVTSNLAFLDPTLSYDLSNVYLTLTRNNIDFAAVGSTPNQRATGGGAESLGYGNPVYDALLDLSGEQARYAYDQLSGEIHASARTAFIEDSRFVRDAALARLRLAQDGPAAANSDPKAAAATDRFAFWARGFGARGHVDGDGNAARLDRSIGGFLTGADGFVDATAGRLGLLAGYSHTEFDVDDRNASGSSDDYHLGIYGGTRWGGLALRGGAAYTWHQVSTERAVAFAGYADAVEASYDAATAQVFAELGYAVPVGTATVEPFANLAYVHVRSDGFSETGGAAALAGAGASTGTSFTTLGLRASGAIALGSVNATARGLVGWQHAFGDVTPVGSLAFAGGDVFAIAGVPVTRDAALIEGGLDVALSPRATLGISYAGQIGSGFSDQSMNAHLDVRF